MRKPCQEVVDGFLKLALGGVPFKAAVIRANELDAEVEILLSYLVAEAPDYRMDLTCLSDLRKMPLFEEFLKKSSIRCRYAFETRLPFDIAPDLEVVSPRAITSADDLRALFVTACL